MIEFMEAKNEQILAFRASGTLTHDDYMTKLIPVIEQKLTRFEKLRVLFYLDQDFHCWSWRAAWDNTLLDFRFRKSFEKIAVVGAPLWEERCVRVASLIIRAELKTFKGKDLALAWTWIESAL